MVSDLPLFVHGGLARNTDPDTSHLAAALTDVQRTERIVLQAMRDAPGGLTTHEIEARCGLAAGSVTPRMKPLEEKGLVVRTDERRIPRGHRSRQIVWRLVTAEFRVPAG